MIIPVSYLVVAGLYAVILSVLPCAYSLPLVLGGVSAVGVGWYLFADPRASLRAREGEIRESWSRRSRVVLAELDVVDDLDDVLGAVKLPSGKSGGLVGAYRMSRVVRACMHFPKDTTANRMVASGKLQEAMREAGWREHQIERGLPMALALVFVRSRDEFEAEMFTSLVKDSWRDCGRATA